MVSKIVKPSRVFNFLRNLLNKVYNSFRNNKVRNNRISAMAIVKNSNLVSTVPEDYISHDKSVHKYRSRVNKYLNKTHETPFTTNTSQR